jgi:hypothetical protein
MLREIKMLPEELLEQFNELKKVFSDIKESL